VKKGKKTEEVPLSLVESWMDKWEEALKLWSRFVRLKKPLLLKTAKEESEQGLDQSFAMIRLTDHGVVISLRMVMELGLREFPLEVMAHEIGHHVYCPADLTDLGRMLARMRHGLPSVEEQAGLVANLYSDLMINDRLFRDHGLKMEKLYKKIRIKSKSRLWNFYMRIYEILWSLRTGELVSMEPGDGMEADAQLGYRLIRSYQGDWLPGAGRFAALCLTYLLDDRSAPGEKGVRVWMDAGAPGKGADIPPGLAEMDPGEKSSAEHPALGEDVINEPVEEGSVSGGGNYREPFEYGQILKSLGIDLSGNEIAVRYYRERAVPWLVPFPSVMQEESTEPLPEGLDVWDISSPLDEIDWTETAVRSPVVVPGVTTFERVFGTTEGSEPEREPVDLDLYVDCSGSMPDPAVNVSYLTLAGAIISLSALRSGSRVQATLWSGTDQFSVTKGFVRNEKEILSVLTGYFGGGTAFPLHILRKTYSKRDARSRKVHILVISDEGVTTMYDRDEKNNDGYDIASMALEKAGGGGTMVLNLYGSWKENPGLVRASEQGWEMASVSDWSGLLAFSREFSKKHYGGRRS
jgi:hypothetical protein